MSSEQDLVASSCAARPFWATVETRGRQEMDS